MGSGFDVQAFLAAASAQVDAELERALPPATTPPAALHGAMRHLVFPAGKRFRPALALAAAEAVGGPRDAALPVAAAVELVHTYSLIHDDLPCMDDDVERRGRPTVHVAYGEAVALLAGDALLALAFEVLSADAAEPADALANLALLARTAGAAQLVGGQVDDLAFVPDDDGGQDRVESIHMRKTAALIRAAILGGARAAGAKPEALDRLGRFGASVGVAFQIADDLLDAEDDAGCSLVAVLGAAGARERAEELLGHALLELAGFGDGAEPLRELARMAVRRKR